MADAINIEEGDVNLGPRRQAWQAAHIGPETRGLLAEDARWFLHQSMSTPCLNALSAAAGSRIVDLEGRAYLDFHGNSLHQIGHGHPKVVAAVKQTLDTLPFSPRRYTNLPAVALARALCQAAPIDGAKLLLAPGGTAAIGMALKLARLATGKFKTLSMWDSFHGASLDAISIGGEAVFRRGIGPLLPGSEHVPPHDPGHCAFGCQGSCALRCVDYIDYCLEKEGDVAAVIVETIRATDVQIPPIDYYRRLRAACDRHGALLILDEIPIALGRTGHLFAIERYGIEPDMLVIGKGLGGGLMPLAALIAHPRFDVGQHISLGHYTHEKSPLACAAALATLDVIADEQLCERSRTLGAQALQRLQDLARRCPAVAEARGAGLLLALELRDHNGRTAADLAEAVLYRCLTAGLSFKVGQGTVLVLAPPLNIAEDDLFWALDTVEQALKAEIGA
ncbi:MAG: aspartate aminotransferase family protein [Paludibacterium sp.]|uniref:(R)-1-hydroxy-2-aminoethylphosphonate ammonia-lyase n=1 Tax=Paludibacterium sp. TaxID=1917523 RepID=UPI0025DB71C8|nr:aspartate aminotransferase family protein [Paludibacterium sp.]MBV8047674.1 aspartate aminotransferase family protein [Paludibacterium sp.]MBV8648867.1 aspartate aminotransferase family protein [Paludibacterium sp.]